MQLNESATAEFSQKKWRAWSEKAIEIVLAMSALSCIGITLAIVGILLYESWGFFQQVPLLRFLTDEMWTPGTEQYGVKSLVSGTLVTTIVATLVNLPSLLSVRWPSQC
jgi:phosphate transport system permease protein